MNVHNTMSPARVPSGVERSNHEATAPPHVKRVLTGCTAPFVNLLYITKMSTIGLSDNTIIVAYLIKSKVSVLERAENCC